MPILGLNAYHGDASVSLLAEDRLIFGREEERFSRLKHQAGFPSLAARHSLDYAGLSGLDLEHIAISRDPSAQLHRKLMFTLSQGPRLASVRDRLSNVSKLRDIKTTLAESLSVDEKAIRAQIHPVEHHRAHLASSFFVSPFDRAALLSIDGFGDFISTMWAVGEGHSIEVLGLVEYPHSTGIVYSATTQFLGFPHYGDEGKVMGLAPYGQPRFIDEFREIISLEPQGRFRLNLDYFRHASEGVQMTWEDGSPTVGRIFSDEYERTFGPRRNPNSQITDRESDIAASLQLRLEEVVFQGRKHLHDETGLTEPG